MREPGSECQYRFLTVLVGTASSPSENSLTATQGPSRLGKTETVLLTRLPARGHPAHLALRFVSGLCQWAAVGGRPVVESLPEHANGAVAKW